MKVKIEVKNSYLPMVDEKMFEFETPLANHMTWAQFNKIDDELATATDDYVRADFATYDEYDGEIEIVYGVTLGGHYVNTEHFFAMLDVLDAYGYSVVYDESQFEVQPDLPLCYWEE